MPSASDASRIRDDELREYRAVDARARQARRCLGVRVRGVGGLRHLGHRPQRSSVDTIEHHRDKGISVTVYAGDAAEGAPRPCEHFGFLAVRARADRGRRVLDRAPDRGGRLRGPARARAARARHARPRPVPSVGPRGRGGDRASRSGPSARRSRCRRRSATPRARRFRRSTRSSCSPTASASCTDSRPRATTLSLSVIAEDRGKMQRDDWYSAARVPSAVADPAALGATAGERALARLSARKVRDLQGAGAVRGAGGMLADRQLSSPRRAAARCTARRRSSPMRSASRCSRRQVTIEERPRERQGTRELAVRRGRRGDRASATVVRDGVLRRLLPRQLFRAQARHALDRQRGRQPQPRRARSAGDRPARHAEASCDRGLFVTELLGPRREPGDRRLLARRGGLLGRRRRDRATRSRRSPSPETCATCSGASPASAATRWCAARARLGSILVESMTIAGD